MDDQRNYPTDDADELRLILLQLHGRPGVPHRATRRCPASHFRPRRAGPDGDDHGPQQRTGAHVAGCPCGPRLCREGRLLEQASPGPAPKRGRKAQVVPVSDRFRDCRAAPLQGGRTGGGRRKSEGRPFILHLPSRSFEIFISAGAPSGRAAYRTQSAGAVHTAPRRCCSTAAPPKGRWASVACSARLAWPVPGI